MSFLSNMPFIKNSPLFSNQTDLPHNFLGKRFNKNNIVYFLANMDNSYTYQNEALYGAQHELYTTVNSSLTFVIDMSEKQQNNFLNKPLLLNNIQYFKLSPFTKFNRFRHLLPDLAIKEKRKLIKFHNQFNLTNVLFLNILNNKELEYKKIVKQHLSKFFEISELNTKEFNNYKELSNVLTELKIQNNVSEETKENIQKCLDFVQLYKDILFFDINTFDLFSIVELKKSYVEFELDDLTFIQQTQYEPQDIESSKILWGNDLLSLYEENNYTYLFNYDNVDSKDDVFQSFITQLIKITAEYLNSKQYNKNVLYCLYNCNDRHYIKSLIKNTENNVINKHIDVLSVHYIDNNPSMSLLDEFLDEHLLNHNDIINESSSEYPRQKQLDEKSKLNYYLNISNGMLLLPCLDIKEDNLKQLIEQTKHIYDKIIDKSKQYKVYHLTNENSSYEKNLDEDLSSYQVGMTFCFNLLDNNLSQYKMKYYVQTKNITI